MNFPSFKLAMASFAITMFAAALSCEAARADDKFPVLNVYNTVYPNACSEFEQRKLWKAISGKVKDASAVKRALHAILCVPPTSPERAYLAGLFPVKLRERLEGTGEEPSFEIVRRSDALIDRVMAAGEAWGARVEVKHERIDLQYLPNEVCIRGITLSYRRAKWMVDELSEACD